MTRHSSISSSEARAIFVMAVISIVLWYSPSKNGGDVIAYWAAVQAVLQGLNPYDPVVLLSIQQHALATIQEPQYFLNPPWAIPLLIPLFVLPFDASRAVLSLMNVTAFAYCLTWCSQRWGRLPRFFIAISAVYIPFLACQYTGQLSVLPMMGLLILLDVIDGKASSSLRIAAGLYLCSLKPQALYLFLIFFPILILKREGFNRLLRVSLWSIPFVALLAWRSDWCVGWLDTFHYSSRWRTSTTTTYIRDFLLLFGADDAKLFWIYQVFWVGVLAALGPTRIFSQDWINILLIVSTLTAPYAWIYDFCVLMPVYYLSLHHLTDWWMVRPNRSKWLYYLALALSFNVAVPLYAFLSDSFEVYIFHSLGLAGMYTSLLMLRWLNPR